MTRNLKALGLLLMACMALGATAASSASAADVTTVVGGGSQAVSGVGDNHIFYLTNGSGARTVETKCTTASFTATVTNGSSEITATPTYTGLPNKTPHTVVDCELNAGLGEAVVKMNGCDYLLTGNTTAGDAQIHVVCPAGKEIEIVATSGLCTIDVPTQTPTSGGVHYTNEAGGKVNVIATVTGITYTGTGAFCPIAGVSAEGNNADYEGSVIVAGTNGISSSGS